MFTVYPDKAVEARQTSIYNYLFAQNMLLTEEAVDRGNCKVQKEETTYNCKVI